MNLLGSATTLKPGWWNCVEANVEPSWERQNVSVVLTDRKVPKVSVKLLNVESISVSKVNSLVRQFLTTLYLDFLEEFPFVAADEWRVLMCS